jgi:hypothetical protein
MVLSGFYIVSLFSEHDILKDCNLENLMVALRTSQFEM